MNSKTVALRTPNVLVLVCALLGAWPAHTLAKDALEPCGQDFTDPYHKAVNRHIDDAVAQPSSLQLMTFPSFQPESGVRLAGGEVYAVQLRSSFWYSAYQRHPDGSLRLDFGKPKIAVKVSHAPVDAKLARAIEQVYLRAIAKAENADRAGLDGVSYVFSTSAGTCAQTWSPEANTRNGRLVQLMERLRQHTSFSLPIDLQRSEKAIARALKALEKN